MMASVVMMMRATAATTIQTTPSYSYLTARKTMTPSARTIKNHRMDNNNNNNRRRRRGELLQIVSEGTGRFIVGGNWKCNGTRESVKALVEALNKNVPNIEKNCDIYCCPTFLHLPYVKDNLNERFNVCAQNSWVEADLVDPEHHYDSTTGAFTGEISAEMLEDLQVPFVLLGHSERRTLLGDTDEIVGKKVAHARYHGLSVVVCVGETLEERENGTTFDVIFKQLKAVAKEIDDREHYGGSVNASNCADLA
jgi:triosephosphate isomerase